MSNGLHANGVFAYSNGTINNENTAKTINIILDSSSSITLTGDSYVTSLNKELIKKIIKIEGFMNRKDVINYCLELPDVYEDYPFPNDNESVTMKHKNNNKWFALIMNKSKRKRK